MDLSCSSNNFDSTQNTLHKKRGRRTLKNWFLDVQKLSSFDHKQAQDMVLKFGLLLPQFEKEGPGMQGMRCAGPWEKDNVPGSAAGASPSLWQRANRRFPLR
jgi:hypothetical protein